MSSEIRYRLYEPADRQGLLTLFRSVYGAAVDRSTSARTYLDRPFRRSLISIAEADGRIVGTQPCYEFPAKVGDAQVPGALFLDVMTHPDYRGRGIFMGVVQHLRRQCHERGMGILLTTPNRAAGRRFSALPGWHCLGELTPMVRPLALSYLMGRRRPTRAPRSRDAGTVRSMDALDCSVDDVWRRFAGVAPTMIVRDTAYLAWRFSNNGTRHYRFFLSRPGRTPEGIAVSGDGELLGRRVVFLAELMTDPKDVRTARHLLGAIVADARARGASAVIGYFVPGSAGEKLLLRCGFWRVIRPLRPRPYMIWMTTSLDASRAATVLKLASWHMSMGDSDLA